jgi:hypothetical protein
VEGSIERAWRSALTWIVKAAIFMPCATGCLWWVYSMRAAIHGGSYAFSEALHLTIAMAGITTVLCGMVWLLSPILHKKQTWFRLALWTALETGVVLAFYTGLVYWWREQWTPEKGLTDGAAFLPVVGHINAAFFSDFLFLEFLMVVTPLMAILSGVLTPAFDFLQRPHQLKRAEG